MAVDTKNTVPQHPSYVYRLPDWKVCGDVYEGERRIKEQGTVYLPPTESMEADGMAVDQPGWKRYNAYRARAVFHDVFKEAVQAMIGVMHRKPPQIEVPDKLADMLKKVSAYGESAASLLRRVNEHQLVYGRLALLLDVGDNLTVDKAVPYVAFYPGTSLLNWDVGANDPSDQRIRLALFDESDFERDAMLQWTLKNKYRIVCDRDGLGVDEAFGRAYWTARMRDGFVSEGLNWLEPSIAGRKLDFPPVVTVNANDLVAEPESPPLLGLANIALTLYRNEADYQQNLHQQAQDTLVLIGAEDRDATVKTGAGAVIDLKKGGDAKYVGVNPTGLTEQRQAITDRLNMAADRGTRLLDIGEGGGAASGEALRIRVAARTTTLAQVATTGAEGLATILRAAAVWIGADPEKVKVEPFLDFAEMRFGGDELLKLVQAKKLGAPISAETIHDIMRSHDMTSKTYEEEMDLVAEEGPDPGATATGSPQPLFPGQTPGQQQQQQPKQPGAVPGQSRGKQNI